MSRSLDWGRKKNWYSGIERILRKVSNNTQLSVLVDSLKESNIILKCLDLRSRLWKCHEVKEGQVQGPVSGGRLKILIPHRCRKDRTEVSPFLGISQDQAVVPWEGSTFYHNAFFLREELWQVCCYWVWAWCSLSMDWLGFVQKLKNKQMCWNFHITARWMQAAIFGRTYGYCETIHSVV